ncbi:MAG: DNA polymerase III subunit beta, partial [Deltaproteobacteria bacterium]|nr:DNA polymerase III subunit beta [Deltaproteobacteria bacterium]
MFELVLKKEELLKGISITQSIAEKRTSMPILSNVLLDIEGGKLCITATDLEISFKGTYEAEIVNPGRLTIPARKFYEIVNVMADEMISLKELENYNLSLSGLRSNYQLHGLQADDFPPMPDYEEITFIDIEADILKEMIEMTIFSTSVEETRYNLGGVFVTPVEDQNENMLRFVSTDGHRLSLKDNKITGLENLEFEKGVIISRKGLTEMKKFTEEGGEVRLGFTSNSAVLIKDEAVLVMRLLDGRFPDYQLVIPKNNDQIMNIKRKDFLDMLRRVAVMSSDRYKGTKFSLQPKNLTLTAINPDLGEAKEDMSVDYE